MNTHSNNPAIGFGYLLRGFGLLHKPGIRRFVALPLLVNVLIFSLLLWIGVGQFEALVNHYLPAESWLGWLRWLLWPLFAVTFLLLLLFGFTLVANLLAAPFKDLLAERVEIQLTGEKPAQRLELLQSVAPALRSELLKIVFFASRGAPVLLLFVIPGINLVAPFAWALFTAWMQAQEYAEYPLGNHQIFFRQQRRLLKKQRYIALGFGGGVMLLLMLPLVNLLLMPAAVSGATIWWVERIKPSLQSGGDPGDA
jgi:CysZ protein